MSLGKQTSSKETKSKRHQRAVCRTSRPHRGRCSRASKMMAGSPTSRLASISNVSALANQLGYSTRNISRPHALKLKLFIIFIIFIIIILLLLLVRIVVLLLLLLLVMDVVVLLVSVVVLVVVIVVVVVVSVIVVFLFVFVVVILVSSLCLLSLLPTLK